LSDSKELHCEQRHPPFVVFDLEGFDHAAILRDILAREAEFEPSTVYSPTGRVINRARRHSLSLPPDRLVIEIGESIHRKVQAQSSILSQLAIAPFKPGHLELRCVCFQDGAYFKKHRDFVRRLVSQRKYTWVYYFHREPQAFTGGELLFFCGSDEPIRVRPKSGQVIVFRSDIEHEVSEVRVPSGKFSDGRFTLTAFVTEAPTIRHRLESYAWRQWEEMRIPSGARKLIKALVRRS